MANKHYIFTDDGCLRDCDGDILEFRTVEDLEEYMEENQHNFKLKLESEVN